MAIKAKCNKDLFHSDGTKSFTKGESYTSYNEFSSGSNQSSLIDMSFVNNQGERHSLGMWYKHFNIIS